MPLRATATYAFSFWHRYHHRLHDAPVANDEEAPENPNLLKGRLVVSSRVGQSGATLHTMFSAASAVLLRRATTLRRTRGTLRAGSLIVCARHHWRHRHRHEMWPRERWAGHAERRLPPMVPPNLDADGSATTYPDARAALGGNATKMVDLCLTMACDDAMSNLLNMFLYP